MRRPTTWLLVSLFLWYSCQQRGSESWQHPLQSSLDSLLQSVAAKRFDASLWQNGKHRYVPVFSSIYVPSRLDTFDLPIIHGELLKGLEQQRQLLQQTKPRRRFRIGDLQFDLEQLEQTVTILQSRQHTKPLDLPELLNAYQLWGGDRRGNVLFTGYYTPVIPVSQEPTDTYRFPIYDRPRDWTGPLPTRAEIEEKGVLDSLELEIAYARNKVDIYYMQLQGSGFVEYPDGTKELLSYNGTNRHPYRSIEKYILSRTDWDFSNVTIPGIKEFLESHPELRDSVLYQNPSYTFFKSRNTLPRGAGNVPLQGGISVAVDQRYIPLGSVLLAAIPIFDPRRHRVVGHEYRFLLAQDVGGRIKGPGHVDLYFGIGKEARAQAMRMNQYGQLWLLLPKSLPVLISMNDH